MKRLPLFQSRQTPEKSAFLIFGKRPVWVQYKDESRLIQIMLHEMMEEMLYLLPTVLTIEFLVKDMSDFLE